MDIKNLAMVNFVKNKFKKKVMVRFVYDDNINQRVTMESIIIALNDLDTYKNNLLKSYPDTLVETKLSGVPTLMNVEVMDRLICNLEHL